MSEFKMVKTEAHLNMLPYPIDMSLLLTLAANNLDEKRERCNSPQGILPSVNHPTRIVQNALANWNIYLTHNCDEHREIFMAQAEWLLVHRLPLSNGACCWPVSSSSNAQDISRHCLSALTQGNAISVLLRAFQLTGKDMFLQAAHQTVRTFELDILDGGVCAPIGDEGVFFEEVAVYPASHVLSAHILALFGLYDYLAFTHDNKIEVLIQQGIDTLHIMLNEFDTGYWTLYDLLHKCLAPRFYHYLHVTLLEALAKYSGCEHCAMLATRWAGYQRRLSSSLRYLITSHARAWYDSKLKYKLRHIIFRTSYESRQTRHVNVCIPITAFPVAGGMRSVLAGVAQAMENQWKIIYLTHHKGQSAEGLKIVTFGRRLAFYWQFPFVWFYCATGCGKLSALLHSNPDFDLILPQDGVYTAAFAALIGKLAGVRVICMDHGNVTLLDNPAFRSEVIRHIKGYPWYRQIVARLQLAFYWKSLRLLAHVGTYCSDQFLIAGDEVEAIYRKNFSVHPSRIIRYAYMLDVDRFTPPDKETRTKIRAKQGIRGDAITITLINRLAPEKGLNIAIEGIARAVSVLSTDVRERVKVLIAGDGPLRSQVEVDIRRHGLDSVCELRGEVAPSEVVTLLAISDIFLYSGTRGTNYSMAVLEAMASGCAVIASTQPFSNEKLLAEGRGIAISAGDPDQAAQALVRLLTDMDLRRRMGKSAREYIATYHSETSFRRVLQRATYWSELDSILHDN